MFLSRVLFNIFLLALVTHVGTQKLYLKYSLQMERFIHSNLPCTTFQVVLFDINK